MSLTISSSYSCPSKLFTAIVQAYLGEDFEKEPEEISRDNHSELQRRAKRPKLLQRPDIIYDFFLDYISCFPSYLKYNPFICDEEFDAHTLTRFLTPTQRAQINAFPAPLAMDTAGTSPADQIVQKINEFVVQLQESHGILEMIQRYEELPRLALIAHLKRGDVSKAQVTSISLLYQGIMQFIVDPVLIRNNQIIRLKKQTQPVKIHSPSDFDLMQTKIRSYSAFDNQELIKKFFKLENLDAFLERLKNKPDSERYYHALPLPIGGIDSWSPGYSVITKILKIANPVITCEKFNLKHNVMIIPSFSMLQAYVDVVYGVNAMPMAPLFGACTKEVIISLKLANKRPIHISMQEALTPVSADNYYFGPLLYSIHDFYHELRDCEVSKLGRKALCYIVEKFYSQSINENTDKIIWQLMDGELYFREDLFGRLFSIHTVTWDKKHIDAILYDMVLKSDFWERSFGITKDHLQSKEQGIYNQFFLVKK